ncbi:MAG: hypothetical protein R3F43_01385 [bacterium]
MLLDPDSPQTLALDGQYWLASGEADRAADRLTTAAAADERQAGIWLLRARRCARGDLEAARADLDRAVALDPSQPVALAERGRLALALGERLPRGWIWTGWWPSGRGRPGPRDAGRAAARGPR